MKPLRSGKETGANSRPNFDPKCVWEVMPLHGAVVHMHKRTPFGGVDMEILKLAGPARRFDGRVERGSELEAHIPKICWPPSKEPHCLVLVVRAPDQRLVQRDPHHAELVHGRLRTRTHAHTQDYEPASVWDNRITGHMLAATNARVTS